MAELTAREQELLRILVDEKRVAIGRKIAEKQEMLKKPNAKDKEQISQMMRSEMKVWNELRAISEKLDR